MAMQIIFNGQSVTIERDEMAKVYIVTWEDGTHEKIPFGQKKSN